MPLSGNDIKSAARVKGHSFRPGESLRGHYSYGVEGDYFSAMGLPLRQGRYLTAADSRGSTRVCVVDEDFARRYWPDGRALGQRIFQGSDEGPDTEAFTVVGVVGAVKQADMTEDTAQGAIYYPLGFRLDNELFIVVGTSVPPETFASTLQQVVRRLDPDLPVTDIQSMDTRITESLVARRSPALLAAHLLEPCGAADRDRHVRRPELRRLAAAARNRSAHGARRRPAAGPPSVPVRGLAATCSRVSPSASPARGPPATLSRASCFVFPRCTEATIAGDDRGHDHRLADGVSAARASRRTHVTDGGARRGVRDRQRRLSLSFNHRFPQIFTDSVGVPQ